jgi:glycosyltransferase involved in cell wall biosynthesis
MHIGVLTHNYPRFSGDFSGTFVEALCDELARQGHRVTVWAPYDPAYTRPIHYTPALAAGGTAPASGGIAPASGDIAPQNVTLRLYRYAFPARFHRLGYMRSMQSDLALRLEAYLLSPALFAAGTRKLLADAAVSRPDVLHAHWVLPNGFIGALAGRRLGIPLAVSVPGSDAQVAAKNPLFRRMAAFTFAQAGLLTANSAELRDAVLPLGADLGKFDMIIYGTDPNTLRPDSRGTAELRAKLAIAAETPVLLCVGRMVYKKGFDVLIRALAEQPLVGRDLSVVMVGGGDELAAWQQLARDLGVGGKIHWVGSVPKTEIGVYYNMADMLLMPSVSKPADGLNVCVLDAMSCGKPVIASTVAGNPLAVVHGVTGLLTPEQDPLALAQAIESLLDDPGRAREMGAAGRRRIEEELGWPQLARRYVQHFEQMQR